MNRLIRIGIGGILLGAFASPASATLVTVHSGSMFIRAYDGVPLASENTMSAALPLDTEHTRTDGSASNTTAYDFDHGGFLIDVEHVRWRPGVSNNSHTQSRHTLPIEFSVDQDAPYALSGFYNMSGSDQLVFYAQLVDASAGNAVLFRNQQRSYMTSGESFTLGEMDGDTTFSGDQFLSGSLTGTLIAGHHYKLEYNFLIQNGTASSSSASALGQLHLQIVSEPSSVMLLIAAAFPLMTWRSRVHFRRR